jgi:hypothetical protein
MPVSDGSEKGSAYKRYHLNKQSNKPKNSWEAIAEHKMLKIYVIKSAEQDKQVSKI